MNPYLEKILGNIEAIGVREFPGFITSATESCNGGVVTVQVNPSAKFEAFPLYDSNFKLRQTDEVLNEVMAWIRSVVEEEQ